MLDVLRELKTTLENAGNDNDYYAFDTIPVSTKGKMLTIISAKNFESLTPVYSEFTVYMPFRTELEISAAAPENCSMTELYTYFDTMIRPALDTISGLSGRICRMSIRHDSSMRRLVLTAGFSATGIRRIERSGR